MADEPNGKSNGVKFVWSISLGAVLQLVLVMITIVGSVTVGYQMVMTKFADQISINRLTDARFTWDEHAAEQHGESDRSSSAETRAALTKIIDNLSEYRAEARAAAAAAAVQSHDTQRH